MLAILVGACFLANRHTDHHKVPTVTEDGVERVAEPSSIFTTLYYHVIPSPIVAAHGADAHGADAHGADAHGADAHGADAHGVDAHGHDDHAGDDHGHAASGPLVSIPFPGFLSAFDGDPHKDGTQFVMYNLQIFQIAALLMILVAFSGVPSYLRTGKGDYVSRLMGGFALWLRDDLVEPAMGKELSAKLLPLMMFLFFFILFMNVMGLTPMSVTPTASIFVTGALALITFTLMIVGGIIAQGPVDFFKNLVPHVPGFLWPLMFLIEVAGLIIKPVALMIRLFATITGGHLVVLSFMALIFFFWSAFGSTVGTALSPVWVGFAVFIMIIEAFVALVQAYIFTLLSSLFIGAAVHPEH
ncbi:ATP synthase subunit a [Planctomycetes bacterium Poly30]|uniref:ATP synthase subunit a n=2 Tax=Saltatorellus ferox TaxID=2528018 RepID=A0A518ERR3_9BACT|nr:ATP synthase subunit a [Planctomycetes bacterium Poly30]